ncbi:MAG: DUF3159 domain-containing protein [Bifidobacteriaceae bacterium]|jgi:hypothetical protein|nr:DUF3159 domain-containing protein [Bifidobacteriaceae bacterium]MCI1978779.1 DUF3159 domain-containing protein [Bifidobacteriaceae bacterium]
MKAHDDASSLRSGIASVVDEDFSVKDAIGGVRGAIESVLPGLAFVVVFVATRNLGVTVIVAASIAAICVVARLLMRQQVRSALTGVLSIIVCLVWAWLSKDAKNFYLPGFLTNAFWIIVLVVSLGIRIPGIGALVEFVRNPVTSGFRQWVDVWRSDRHLLRAYVVTTWVWVGMFALRLVVQLPLYLMDSVGFLGTARLVMGVPLFALTIWISWIFISPQIRRREAQEAAKAAVQAEILDMDTDTDTHMVTDADTDTDVDAKTDVNTGTGDGQQ